MSQIAVSCCTIAWRERPLEEAVETIAGIGFDGVELFAPHLDVVAARGAEALGRLSQRLGCLGLAVPVISPYLPLMAGWTEEGRHPDLERYLRYATVLGAPAVRGFFSDTWASSQASQAQREQAVGCLRAMADAAAAHDLNLLLETHPGQLFDTSGVTLRLLNEVDRLNVRVLLDIWHLFKEGGEDAVIATRALLGVTDHVHVKNLGRGAHRREQVPLDEGEMPYGPFFQALMDGGWRGFVSVEWFEPRPDMIARDLSTVRRFFGDADASE